MSKQLSSEPPPNSSYCKLILDTVSCEHIHSDVTGFSKKSLQNSPKDPLLHVQHRLSLHDDVHVNGKDQWKNISWMLLSSLLLTNIQYHINWILRNLSFIIIYIICNCIYVYIYNDNKGCHRIRKVHFFFKFFKKPFAPPPPFRLNIMWWIFFVKNPSASWQAIGPPPKSSKCLFVFGEGGAGSENLI